MVNEPDQLTVGFPQVVLRLNHATIKSEMDIRNDR